MKDWGDEDIAGSFYNQEIQVIDKKADEIYLIERILKNRKAKGNKKEYFVKWKGWPDTFNSWIPEKDLQKVNGR